MKIRLEGIGMLPSVSLSVEGMTVITGINNTGKSTIMKSIYTLADSASNLDFDIQHEIMISANRLYGMYQFTTNKELDSLSTFLTAIQNHDRQTVISILEKINTGRDKDYFEKISKYILDYVEGKPDKISFLKRLVKDNIEAEFCGQIRNAKQNKSGKIEFEESGSKCGIIIDENNDVEPYGNIFEFDHCPFYIDTPYRLDNILDKQGSGGSLENHLDKTIRLLEKKNNMGAINRMVAEEEMRQINSLINKVITGVMTSKGIKAVYEYDDMEINIKNIATGMKTFTLLKMLIERGLLAHNSLLLFDEPEAHIHPEWQSIMAELLILMVKDMGIKVITTTHSPQMLLSIQAHSLKHRVNVDYYNASKKNNKILIENVNNELDKVYEPMATAYNNADELYWNLFAEKVKKK